MYRLLLMLRGFESSGRMELVPPAEAVPLLLDLKRGRVSLQEVRKMIVDWKAEMEKRYDTVLLRAGMEGENRAEQQLIHLAREAVYRNCIQMERYGRIELKA